MSRKWSSTMRPWQRTQVMIALLGAGRGTHCSWTQDSADAGQYQTERKYLGRRAPGSEEEGLEGLSLVCQFVPHRVQQLRHAKRLVKGLPGSEQFRDNQTVCFPAYT